MESSVRAFTAGELSEGVRAAVARIQEGLRPLGGDVKWVAREHLHLTFHFLGEIPRGAVQEVAGALEDAAQGIHPFEYRVGGLGSFPPGRAPRVVWIGVLEGTERLRDLHARAARALRGTGGAAGGRREYHPHITLGRVRGPRGTGALRRRIEAAGREPDRWQRLDAIVLFESRLGPGGPRYTELRRIRLSGGS